MASRDLTLILRPSNQQMYGVGIGVPLLKFSSQRLEAAAKSEGSMPCGSKTFWGARHSGNTHSLGANLFMGHRDKVHCKPVALGQPVYWVQTGRAQISVLLQ